MKALVATLALLVSVSASASDCGVGEIPQYPDCTTAGSPTYSKDQVKDWFKKVGKKVGDKVKGGGSTFPDNRCEGPGDIWGYPCDGQQ